MAQLTANIIEYIVKMHCTLLSFLSSYRKEAQQTLSVFGKLGLVQHLVSAIACSFYVKISAGYLHRFQTYQGQ